jgi:phosphoribosyl-ATP pyrophosphohydrolase/phosphoribosyl-AMP cyclohydrolase
MNLNFEKYPGGLLPVIIQDNQTNKVLMLGYMNAEAVDHTISGNQVVFYSRSKQRLWMKGETSGNFLTVNEILPDCDNDCLLIKATPAGPVCHTGADTCFNETNDIDFLDQLEQIIIDRRTNPHENSYTSSLFKKGINKIAQKLGEEAIELVIESKDNNDEKFLNEAADLLYHYLVLLQTRNYKLNNVVKILKDRHPTNNIR